MNWDSADTSFGGFGPGGGSSSSSVSGWGAGANGLGSNHFAQTGLTPVLPGSAGDSFGGGGGESGFVQHGGGGIIVQPPQEEGTFVCFCVRNAILPRDPTSVAPSI